MNQKKERIIEEAHRLFVEKGYTNTSIQDILDAAKIAKGTFYNYFTSKTECLITILELAKEESTLKRQELLVGKSRHDENILIEQIAIRMKTDRKNKLMALFQTASVMADKDLASFMVSQHVDELKWLAGRLVDLYGEDVRDIAFDQAVIMTGILHNVLQTSKILGNVQFPIEMAIQYALKQLKPLIEQQLSTGEILFRNTMNPTGAPSAAEAKAEAQRLVQVLLEAATDEQEKELISFLAEELHMKKPRLSLIISVWNTLSHALHPHGLNPAFKQAKAAMAVYLEMAGQIQNKENQPT